MFRSSLRRQREISQLADETTHDLQTLRDEMSLARKKSIRNLRDEMQLARKLSFRRIDQQPAVKPPPCQKIEYSREAVGYELDFSPPCSPIRQYPTRDEISSLPSSRDFAVLLDEEFDHHEEESKPSVTAEELRPTNQVEKSFQQELADEDNEHSNNSDVIEIEIFPGVFRELRGSEETQHAWDNGLCAQVSCVVCEADMAFVWDCEFVICPVCRAVLPVDATETGFDKSIPSLQVSLESSASGALSFPDPDAVSPSRVPAKQRGVGLGIRIL